MNKSTGRLFAWANPVTRLNLVDHTWVTDYDVPPIHKSPPPPPDSNLYWWCWGKYHPDGTGGIGHPQHGAIGNASVDLSTASNIVEPNISPKSPVKPNKGLGTIAYYGIDGVCHQVANQTLYATGSKTAEPLRVHGARGYSLSTFFFHNYGLQTEAWAEVVATYAPEIKVPDDDFMAIMEKVIQIPEKSVFELLSVRTAAQQSLQELRKDAASKSHIELRIEIIEVLGKALEKLHKTLGKTDFEKLFPPFEKIIDGEWIDASMVEQSVQNLQG